MYIRFSEETYHKFPLTFFALELELVASVALRFWEEESDFSVVVGSIICEEDAAFSADDSEERVLVDEDAMAPGVSVMVAEIF